MVELTCPNCQHTFRRELKKDAPVVNCPQCRTTFSAANYLSYEEWEQTVAKIQPRRRRTVTPARARTSGLSTYHVRPSQYKPARYKTPAHAYRKDKKPIQKTAPAPIRASKSTGSMRPLIPVKFGPFKRMEEISRGGMGAVYKAYDSRHDQHVALKVLLPWGEKSDEVCERFVREANCAEHVQHPGIVKVYDAGEIEGQMYIAMELVEGRSLDAMMRKRRGRINIEEAIEIMFGVAGALAAAHEAGIIHRDIKPGNILISAVDVPKLTDFGLARDLADETRLTQTGAIMGTPAYMSPEQADGKTGKIGPATDVWAMGAVMYELLTGLPPFRGDTAVKLSLEICNKRPRPPRLINPKIPEDIETIIMKCLVRDSAKRYPSARQLADDLQSFLEGRPISAKPHRPITALVWRPQVRKVLAAGVSVVLLGALIFGGVSFFSDGSHVEAAGASEQETGPVSLDSLIAKGRAAYQSGDVSGAIDILTSAAYHAEGKKKAEIAMLLGVIQFRRKNYSESEKQFDLACQAMPDNAELWYRLGSIRIQIARAATGDAAREAYMQAYNAFSKVLTLDPRHKKAKLFYDSLKKSLRL